MCVCTIYYTFSCITHYDILLCTVGDVFQGAHVPTDINLDNALDFMMTPQAATNDPWKSHTLDAESAFSASDTLRPREPLATDVQLLPHAQRRLDTSLQSG